VIKSPLEIQVKRVKKMYYKISNLIQTRLSMHVLKYRSLTKKLDFILWKNNKLVTAVKLKVAQVEKESNSLFL
jgi:hypothetical protein